MVLPCWWSQMVLPCWWSCKLCNHVNRMVSTHREKAKAKARTFAGQHWEGGGSLSRAGPALLEARLLLSFLPGDCRTPGDRWKHFLEPWPGKKRIARLMLVNYTKHLAAFSSVTKGTWEGLGVMAQVYRRTLLGRPRQDDLRAFKASLVYVVHSRAARATLWDPVLTTNKQINVDNEVNVNYMKEQSS